MANFQISLKQYEKEDETTKATHLALEILRSIRTSKTFVKNSILKGETYIKSGGKGKDKKETSEKKETTTEKKETTSNKKENTTEKKQGNNRYGGKRRAKRN